MQIEFRNGGKPDRVHGGSSPRNNRFGSTSASQPRRAASIAATSILPIVIMASNARLAAAGSGPVTASVSATGVICQDTPHLSWHQPQAFSWPPLPTMAFH